MSDASASQDAAKAASNGTAKKVAPAARRKARRLAVQALYQWQLSGNALTSIELEFREDNDMRKVDDEYFSELLHEIPKRVKALDAMIAPLADRKSDDLTPIERTILRIGAYELAHRPDVPFRVVINEGVELAKTFGATDGHKYVNGILDGLARQVRAADPR